MTQMTQASDKRWIVAQRAEKKYSHILEHIELPTESQFFSKSFPLNSEFFFGKSILEVGCSPAAEIHYLEEAHFRVGIDPLVCEGKHLYLETLRMRKEKGYDSYDSMDFDEKIDVMMKKNYGRYRCEHGVYQALFMKQYKTGLVEMLKGIGKGGFPYNTFMRLFDNSSCKHFFTLPEDPVMVRKIKPQRAQSTQRVVIFLFRPLCVLCGFPKPYFENIKMAPGFWSLQREMSETHLCEGSFR